MTTFQKIIKYCAVAFAIFLTVSIIGGALATLGSLTWLFGREDNEDIPGEMQSYTVNQDIRELRISIGAADCEIVTGEAFSVESNSAKLRVRDSGGKLSLDDSTRNIKSGRIKIIVTVPANAEFEKIDISTGAGDIKAMGIVCKSLDIECGAGDVDFTDVTATFRTEIDGGVGDVTLKNSSLNNSEIDMGVGNFDFSGELYGSSDLDFGVGEAEITLYGGEVNYTVTLDKGIGRAEINGEAFTDGSTFGKGENRIDIDSGVGDVEVVFADAV